MLTVSYRTTNKDLVNLSLYIARTTPAYRNQYRFSWASIPILSIIASAVAYYLNVNVGIVISIAIVGIIYAVIFPWYYWNWIEGVIRRGIKQLGTHGTVGQISLIFDDEKLTELTESTKSESKWDSVEKIITLEEVVYIFITGITIAIIPKRGFEREEEYNVAKEYTIKKLADKCK